MVALTDRNLRLGMIVRIETDTPIRFWSGIGVRHIPADAIETTGGNYLGINFPVDLPKFKMLFNGKAESLVAALTGADDRLIALVDAESSAVRGRMVNMAIIQFDADLQLAAAPYWMIDQSIGKVGFNMAPQGDLLAQAGHSAGVSLTLTSGDVRRKRPRGGYWTPDRATGGDLGLSHMPGNDAGATRLWPPPGL